MPRRYWMIKQEPESYPWEQFVRDGATAWTGVRNYQARNHLRAMKKDDWVLYYHSGSEKRVVGVATVARENYPDPTAKEGDWAAVDLAALKPVRHPVALEGIKADPALADLPLMKQSRLSVMPLTRDQFQRLMALSER